MKQICKEFDIGELDMVEIIVVKSNLEGRSYN